MASALSRCEALELEAEQVAGEMEGADLPAAIAQKLVGAHRPAHHLVDEFGILALAVDLLVP